MKRQVLGIDITENIFHVYGVTATAHRDLPHTNASSSALASWRSAVSKPSVNQP